MASLKEILAAKAASSAKPAGLTIRKGQPVAPPPRPPGLADDPRQLGQVEKGTEVPFEFASEKNSEAAKLWLLARQQPETKLGIVIEQGETSEHAWLALEHPTDPGMMLYLYRLPILAARSAGAPF